MTEGNTTTAPAKGATVITPNKNVTPIADLRADLAMAERAEWSDMLVKAYEDGLYTLKEARECIQDLDREDPDSFGIALARLAGFIDFELDGGGVTPTGGAAPTPDTTAKEGS